MTLSESTTLHVIFDRNATALRKEVLRDSSNGFKDLCLTKFFCDFELLFARNKL